MKRCWPWVEHASAGTALGTARDGAREVPGWHGVAFCRLRCMGMPRVRKLSRREGLHMEGAYVPTNA